MRALLYLCRDIYRGIVGRFLDHLHRSSPSRDLLDADVARWTEVLNVQAKDGNAAMKRLFFISPEFRSLFFYRVRRPSVLAMILGFLHHPEPALHICTSNIGPGLYIQHGFATIIAAKSIGRNFWINQQVTIGYSVAAKSPVIGDDVTINAGALVIGGITIGDRAKIGAGAVVVKSVPADCTVVGNPARIVRRNGVRVDEPL